MEVSSESLFHFTNSLRNIENILRNRFSVTYCSEVFELGGSIFDEYFPLISFCDLPLGLIRGHIEKYGSYGIGMTKEWGTRNRLNPVLYIEQKSIIAADLFSAVNSVYSFSPYLSEIQGVIKDVDGLERPKALKDVLTENGQSTLNVLRYIKNYKGDLVRNGKKFKDYRFYDEREWRYVPAFNDDRAKPGLTKDEYQRFRGNSKVKPLIDSIKLDFSAEDIKYLIVKSKKDIPALIRVIKSINNLSKNPDEADILTTKILTFEQIKSDM